MGKKKGRGGLGKREEGRDGGVASRAGNLGVLVH